MTAFNEFYPFIKPDMPSCPDIAMDLELARVSNHFCSLGWVYRTEIEDTVNVGDTDFPLAIPTDTQLVGIVSAIKDGGAQFYDFTLDGDLFVLDKEATSDFDLDLTVALKKPMTATDVPDVLFRDHLDTIVFGVKSRLFMSPGKTWTNPELAQYYERLYRQDLSRYTTKAFNDQAHPINRAEFV